MKTYNILLITACLLQLPTLSYTAQAAAATAEAADEAKAAATDQEFNIRTLFEQVHALDALIQYRDEQKKIKAQQLERELTIEMQLVLEQAEETATRLAFAGIEKDARLAIQNMIIADQRAIHAQQLGALQATWAAEKWQLLGVISQLEKRLGATSSR